MKKAIWRDYKAANDSLDIMFDYDYSTRSGKHENKWLTVHFNGRGEPALFWVKHYSRHKKELAEMYPEYDFSGEIDAEKYASYMKKFKSYYPKWGNKNGKDKGNKFEFLWRK